MRLNGPHLEHHSGEKEAKKRLDQQPPTILGCTQEPSNVVP